MIGKEYCEKCTHHLICKYSDDFNNYCNKSETFINSFDIDLSFVTTDIRCNYYNKKELILNR